MWCGADRRTDEETDRDTNRKQFLQNVPEITVGTTGTESRGKLNSYFKVELLVL
jgi:hypothetical protein